MKIILNFLCGMLAGILIVDIVDDPVAQQLKKLNASLDDVLMN